MSQLSKLYQTMANLKDLGLKINDDLIEEVNKLEEDIIKKEILPVLTERIKPALSQVERELVLVVDYVPNEPISVRLSRKRNFASVIPDAKILEIDPKVEHVNRSPNSIKVHRAGATHLFVEFPDGTIISENKATETLVGVVKKIGVMRVRELVEKYGLTFSGVPVVSNRRDSKYGKSQKDLGHGWLLCTHCNNKTKMEFLKILSQKLRLGLKIQLKNS